MGKIRQGRQEDMPSSLSFTVLVYDRVDIILDGARGPVLNFQNKLPSCGIQFGAGANDLSFRWLSILGHSQVPFISGSPAKCRP